MEYFFTQKLPKTMAVKRKKDLILECMLSDPRPHVTWFKNGEKIEVGRLKMPHLKMADHEIAWGENVYTHSLHIHSF